MGSMEVKDKFGFNYEYISNKIFSKERLYKRIDHYLRISSEVRDTVGREGGAQWASMWSYLP